MQGDDGYLTEVTIDQSIAFDALAAKLRGLVDAVAARRATVLDAW